MWRTAFALLALAMLVATAQAQTVEWRHPRNLYTLQPQATGWRQLEHMAQNTLAAFELVSEERVVRMCSIRERPLPASGTQAELNTIIAGLPPPPMQGVSGAHVLNIDGVTVSAFRLDDPQGRAVLFYRTLIVADGAASSHHEVSCGGTPPVTAPNEAAFQAFLNSLHFPTSTSQ